MNHLTLKWYLKHTTDNHYVLESTTTQQPHKIAQTPGFIRHCPEIKDNHPTPQQWTNILTEIAEIIGAE